MTQNIGGNDLDGLHYDLADVHLSGSDTAQSSSSNDTTNGAANGGFPSILPSRSNHAEGLFAGRVDVPKVPFATIPANVVCNVALEVGLSSMEGAGRGILVQEDVPAHSLIFTIKTPLVNIVDDDFRNIVCDHCLTVFYSTEDPNFRVKACGGCKMLSYCSQKCQKLAWKHHHKFECKTFIKMFASGGPGEEAEKYMRGIVKQANLRCFIRLLQLLANNRLSEEIWDNVLSIHYIETTDEKWLTGAKWISMFAKKYMDTKLGRKEILRLLRIIDISRWTIHAPALRKSRSFVPDFGPFAVVGRIFDQFFTLLGLRDPHPSAVSVARRPIKAGEEITIPYGTLPHDRSLRRRILQNGFEFIGACDFCKKDTSLSILEGPLRKKALELAEIEIIVITAFSHPELLASIENTIEEILKSGCGYGAHPMRALHHQAIMLYLGKNQKLEAFNKALLVYFLIEPSMKPAELPELRLNTLFIIVSLMSTGTSTFAADVPPRVFTAVTEVFLHISAKLVSEYQKILGPDAKVTKFEKARFAALKEERDLMNQMAGRNKFVPLRLSKEERDEFVENMNEIFKWSGIPVWTEAQILDEFRGC